MTQNQHVLLQVKHVSKQYHDGDVTTQVLKDVNLEVFKGEQLAIVGSSGSGKSTLADLIAGLLAPTSGTVVCYGQRN